MFTEWDKIDIVMHAIAQNASIKKQLSINELFHILAKTYMQRIDLPRITQPTKNLDRK